MFSIQLYEYKCYEFNYMNINVMNSINQEDIFEKC